MAQAKSFPFTQQELHSILHYDPETGVFTWRWRDGSRSTDNKFNAQFAGKVAGSVHTGADGHKVRHIHILGRVYKAHRLAWFCMTGEQYPEIDHADVDSLNNRFWNLRPATGQLNKSNIRVRANSVLGVKGVRRLPHGKYRARITVDKRSIHLGMFDTAEEAHAVYLRAARDAFGSFARGA